MPRFRSILVGVDFSEASEQALESGVALAAALEAELLVLHAWNPTGWAEFGPGEEAPGWIHEVRESTRIRLERWTERACEAGCTATALLEEGPASRVVTDVARLRGVDLVILGRHGRARLAHVLLGSVSERVVRLAARPVLVVPGEAGSAAAPLPERMLVGIDFSKPSRQALEVAQDLTIGLGARGLVLVHVAPDERELWLTNWSETLHRGHWPYDESSLDAWAKPGRKRGLSIETRVREGRSESVLFELARSEACDWIVVGVRGRTASAALLMGSTTDRILKLADRPVLAVPSRAEAPEAGHRLAS